MPARAASERAPAKPTRKPPAEPSVKLGKLAPNGICASMYGLVERGAGKRPRVARSLRGEVILRFEEGFAPIRLLFAPGEILVEDVVGENGRAPDLVISGSLPDIVHLASAPLFGGVPKPTTKAGRKALARVAAGQVRIEGSMLLARRLLKLLEI